MNVCWRCMGDGYFWRVPDGFNPFYAGAINTARVMEKIRCYSCGGTGGGQTTQVPVKPNGEDGT